MQHLVASLLSQVFQQSQHNPQWIHTAERAVQHLTEQNTQLYYLLLWLITNHCPETKSERSQF